MNNRLKSALNHIKADEALVSKTEVYLRDKLAEKQNPSSFRFKEWRSMYMKKLVLTAAMAVLLIAGGAKVYATPSSYLSVDINPSVELGVNVFGQVVTAEGYNDDGKSVLNGVKVKGVNVAKAVSAVVESAANKGFIANDGSTVVSLTAVTDNDNTAAKLESDAEAGTKEAIAKNGKSAEVRNDKVALARRDEARVLGITPGKLNLIQKLKVVDPTATVEQYKDAKVKDIMKAIQEQKDNGAMGNKDNSAKGKKDNSSGGNKNNGATGNKSSENGNK